MARPWGGDGAAADGSGLGGPFPGGARGDGPKGVSGRKFVILACLGVLAVWGTLYLAFSAWRSRYEALAEFGRTQVAPAIDPMGRLTPPDVDPRTWAGAVADTHTMLIGLTSAGLLDRELMVKLRDDVRSRVARATPETAVTELTHLWDDLERWAGPVISSDVTPVSPNSRHAKRIPRPPRPGFLPVTKPKEVEKNKDA